MAIITFWSNEKEETAKTFSMTAIATLITIAYLISWKILRSRNEI